MQNNIKKYSSVYLTLYFLIKSYNHHFPMQYKIADIKKQQNFRTEVGIEYLIEVNVVCKVLAVIPSTWVVSWTGILDSCSLLARRIFQYFYTDTFPSFLPDIFLSRSKYQQLELSAL
jgi:hypothetical protein